MTPASAHRLLAPVLAITAWIAWREIPGTTVDRLAFTAACHARANAPHFITGTGSHNNPWAFRAFSNNNSPSRDDAPVIVALGDDIDGFFQSSPPSPIDFAVVLTNFQRLGAHKAGIATVLAWDAPDPIGLQALDIALARFDSLVMTAPLSRAAVPEHMPPAFRRASLPINAAHGDVSTLPIVNRIALAGVILGSDNTRAGFQTLDSAKPGSHPPLIARWEDRLVFAFPVLTALDRLNLPIDGMEIQIGSFLKLGPNGPVVPIDRFGCLAATPETLRPMAEIPAESLIDAQPEIFPADTHPPVILADHRSAAEASTRTFSQQLPFMVATLTSDKSLGPASTYPRLSQYWEAGLLLAFTLIVCACARLPSFSRDLLFLLAILAVTAAQFIAAGLFGYWFPGLAAIATTAVAYVLTRFGRRIDKEPV